MNKNFPLRLRKLRKSKKITQKELAEMTGLPLISIRRYESGEKDLRVDDGYKIADALEVKWYELVGLDDHGAGIVGRDNIELTEKFSRKLAAHYSSQNNDAIAIKSLFAGIGSEVRTACAEALIGLFDELNPEGQTEALKRVEELTQIPKYQKRQD